jgi:hypothetical protein
MKPIGQWMFWVYYGLVLIASILNFFLWNPSVETIYIGVVAAFLGFIVQFVERDIAYTIASNLTNIPHIERLFEEEYYSKWRVLLKDARRNVDITHLGLEPPRGRKGTSERSYYDDFREIVKSSPASFRRVERISLAKLAWIEQLLKDFKSVDNFSLFCIFDKAPEDAKRDMSDLLSIQRVDDDHLFIVALREHRSTTGPRDIYIRSKEMREHFSAYFDSRLIGQSVKVIDNGKVLIDDWKRLKKEKLS